MEKVALITGVTGQDGSYLAEFLLDKGYDVHGIIRRSSVDFRERIAHLEGRPHFHLHYGDMSDSMGMVQVIEKVRPTEIYNLAAQSHVQVSFDAPEYTADTDAVGVLRVLEAVRLCGLTETCRIYQASTSELYGKVEEVPQNEKTPFHPYSPYAVAKLYGYWIVKEYREAYNMFCCSGILFNHESERRGETFVTRKITLAAARIAQGKQDKLYLGNLSSLRDWGYAKDYVECMWLILQNKTPEDFVIASGILNRIEFEIVSCVECLSVLCSDVSGKAVGEITRRFSLGEFPKTEPGTVESIRIVWSCRSGFSGRFKTSPELVITDCTSAENDIAYTRQSRNSAQAGLVTEVDGKPCRRRSVRHAYEEVRYSRKAGAVPQCGDRVLAFTVTHTVVIRNLRILERIPALSVKLHRIEFGFHDRCKHCSRSI